VVLPSKPWPPCQGKPLLPESLLPEPFRPAVLPLKPWLPCQRKPLLPEPSPPEPFRPAALPTKLLPSFQERPLLAKPSPRVCRPRLFRPVLLSLPCRTWLSRPGILPSGLSAPSCRPGIAPPGLLALPCRSRILPRGTRPLVPWPVLVFSRRHVLPAACPNSIVSCSHDRPRIDSGWGCRFPSRQPVCFPVLRLFRKSDIS